MGVCTATWGRDIGPMLQPLQTCGLDVNRMCAVVACSMLSLVYEVLFVDPISQRTHTRQPFCPQQCALQP